MAEQMSRFKPGANVPVFATTAVLAGRFVKIVGDKTTQGDYQAGHCGLGERAFGVAELDSAAATEPAHSVERRVNVARRGAVARVTAGAAITAGAVVQSDAAGRAITFDADGTFATLATGVVASNNALTWTSRLPGDDGEEITIALIVTDANVATSTVDVNGRDIVVTLASTDVGSGTITATATQVKAAIDASDVASQLVDVANTGASSGAGVVAAVAETPLAAGVDVGVPLGQALNTVTTLGDVVDVDLF
jgi:hypothetical protein